MAFNITHQLQTCHSLFLKAKRTSQDCSKCMSPHDMTVCKLKLSDKGARFCMRFPQYKVTNTKNWFAWKEATNLIFVVVEKLHFSWPRAGEVPRRIVNNLMCLRNSLIERDNHLSDTKICCPRTCTLATNVCVLCLKKYMQEDWDLLRHQHSTTILCHTNMHIYSTAGGGGVHTLPLWQGKKPLQFYTELKPHSLRRWKKAYWFSTYLRHILLAYLEFSHFSSLV